MAENQPNVTPPSSDAPAPVTTDENKGNGNGSPAPSENNKQVEAYRQQQARADKNASEADDLRERTEMLESLAMEQMRDKAVKEFLTEKGKDYPNVTSDDLVRFASGPDDLEEVAKYLEDKAQGVRQSVLDDVRQVPDDSLTEEQAKAELKKLESSNDPHRFGKFMAIQSRIKRK